MMNVKLLLRAIFLLILLTACTDSSRSIPSTSNTSPTSAATIAQISAGLTQIPCLQITKMPSDATSNSILISTTCTKATGMVLPFHVDVLKITPTSAPQLNQPTEQAANLDNLDLTDFLLDDGHGHIIAKLISDSASINIESFANGKWVRVTGYLLDQSTCKYFGDNIPCINVMSIEELSPDGLAQPVATQG